MGCGQGYLDDHSRSVNAAEAEARGEYPASRCAKALGIPVEAVRRCAEAVMCCHHTSSWYNDTAYYHLEVLRDWLATAEGAAAVAQVREEERVARRSPTQVYQNCRVEWLEWGGTRKHPKVTHCATLSCRVEVKGGTATITKSNGERFQKRLSTRGFRYEAR